MKRGKGRLSRRKMGKDQPVLILGLASAEKRKGKAITRGKFVDEQ